MHATTEVSALFPQQQPTPTPDTALALLDQESILDISGVDATRFLQGQVTCDIAALSIGASTLGARCTPKGRMQSSFRVLKVAEDQYLLAIDAALFEPQRADLAKYAVFFKVTLSEVTEQWLRLGLWGSQTDDALRTVEFAVPASPDSAEQAFAITLPDDAVELWLPASQSSRVEALLRHATAVPLNAWLLRQIRAGIGQVSAPTRESFIPQMLNFQQLGGVSFQKGCYTGQEIVARMQYLGKLKRRMYRLKMATDVAPAAGTPVIDSASGKAVGEVVMTASTAEGIELLAVLQNDAASLPSLRIEDSAEASLELATLPYEEQMAADAAKE